MTMEIYDFSPPKKRHFFHESMKSAPSAGEVPALTSQLLAGYTSARCLVGIQGSSDPGEGGPIKDPWGWVQRESSGYIML